MSAVLLEVSLVVCWFEVDRLGVDSSRPHTVDDDINNLSYHRFGEMRPKPLSETLNSSTCSMLMSHMLFLCGYGDVYLMFLFPSPLLYLF